MHELSVCQALLAQVSDIANTHGAVAVRQIILAVGPLSGVEPTLLADAFRVASVGGCAARAELNFKSCPVKVRCNECGAESECTVTRLICAQCGGYRTGLISGDELLLLRVELVLPSAQHGSIERVN